MSSETSSCRVEVGGEAAKAGSHRSEEESKKLQNGNGCCCCCRCCCCWCCRCRCCFCFKFLLMQFPLRLRFSNWPTWLQTTSRVGAGWGWGSFKNSFEWLGFCFVLIGAIFFISCDHFCSRPFWNGLAGKMSRIFFSRSKKTFFEPPQSCIRVFRELFSRRFFGS